MAEIEFDVCVLGCGAAGFAAAMRATDFDQHVCIVEQGEIGGAGVLWGAMSSKTMWELSKDFANAARVDRGYRAANLAVHYSQVLDTVIKASKEKQYQMLSQIETFCFRPGCRRSITLMEGQARLIDHTTVEIQQNDGHKQRVSAKSIIIATGSKPRPYAGIPVDGERIINSDHILKLKEFPKRMMIIGAGIIGCEFATIFANFQQTEVHILDRAHRVIPWEDNDISDFVSNSLSRNGVLVHHEANLREVRKHDDCIQIVMDHKDGHTEVIEVDVVLVSIGRVPNLDGLGLDAIGVVHEDDQPLKVDHQCRLTENIFAAGDVAGRVGLVNIAEMEGRYAAKAIKNRVKFPLRYSNMSTIMFFNPEISAVGLNEKQCQEQQIPYTVAHYSNSLVNRAIAMRATNGFVKILVSDSPEPKILGMRAAGPQSSASIISVAFLMDHNDRLAEVMKTVHPHPSITEGIQECLRLLSHKSIYKPQAFPKQIRIEKWSPERGKYSA